MEQWKDIPGFEGFYQVSNLGKVRSLDRVVNTSRGPWKYKGRLLKKLVDGRGYLVINLCSAGTQTTRTIHSLVAEVFIGPRLKSQEVRHLDGSRTNCVLSNLVYGTKSDQFADDIRNGARTLGEKWHASKLLNSEVLEIIVRIKRGEKQVALAHEFSVSPQTICGIKKGRRWAHLTGV